VQTVGKTSHGEILERRLAVSKLLAIIPFHPKAVNSVPRSNAPVARNSVQAVPSQRPTNTCLENPGSRLGKQRPQRTSVAIGQCIKSAHFQRGMFGYSGCHLILMPMVDSKKC
jgi:hypothetical protein